MRDTRFNPEVRIHKESYILIKGFKESGLSQPFPHSSCHKDVLELLTITIRIIQTFQGSPHKAIAQGQPLTV
jgi:hypothetical protein